MPKKDLDGQPPATEDSESDRPVIVQQGEMADAVSHIVAGNGDVANALPRIVIRVIDVNEDPESIFHEQLELPREARANVFRWNIDTNSAVETIVAMMYGLHRVFNRNQWPEAGVNLWSQEHRPMLTPACLILATNVSESDRRNLCSAGGVVFEEENRIEDVLALINTSLAASNKPLSSDISLSPEAVPYTYEPNDEALRRFFDENNQEENWNTVY